MLWRQNENGHFVSKLDCILQFFEEQENCILIAHFFLKTR